jgi:protein-S-isoprenylcysteine O-methyltransferase Ste14
MWAGWAALLGSIPVATAGVGLFGSLNAFGIPFEERLLHDRFGGDYDGYRAQVPRWVDRRIFGRRVGGVRP